MALTVGAVVVGGTVLETGLSYLEKPLEGTKAGDILSDSLDVTSDFLSAITGKESRRQKRKRLEEEAAAKKAEAARKEAARRWAATVELRERRLAEIAANGLPFDPSKPVAAGVVATQGGLVDMSAPKVAEGAGLIEPRVGVPGWWLPVGLGSVFLFVLLLNKKK